MTQKKKSDQDMEKALSRLEKWFPPRQILFRTQTEVKYLNLTPLSQKITAGLFGLALLWMGYASFQTIFKDEILISKDDEIAALQAESAEKSKDIETLETTILEKTEDLEKRQGYLKSILENDPTGDLPENDEDSLDNGNLIKESFVRRNPPYFGSAHAAIDARLHAQDFMTYVTARLNVIETEQAEIALRLVDFAKSRLLDIDDMLAPFKLTAEDLAQASPLSLETLGQGGPFIPEENLGIDFSDGDPFPELHESWTKLLQVYSGFQNIPLYEPVKDFYLSSRFGRRKDPFTKKTAWHPGIDLAGWPGTKIYATTGGVVTKAGTWSTYGQMVEIDHGNGFKTRYAHLRKVIAKRGQSVKPGDVLGEMGCTGRCVSTHLHYEVYFNGKLRNPQPFMEAPEDVQQTKKRATNPYPHPNSDSETGD